MHPARATDPLVRSIVAFCPHCGTLLVGTEPADNEPPHRCNGDFEWLMRYMRDEQI
jgi:hypothetical protein